MIDSTANERALPEVLFSQDILRFFSIKLRTKMVPICFACFCLWKLHCRKCALIGYLKYRRTLGNFSTYFHVHWYQTGVYRNCKSDISKRDRVKEDTRRKYFAYRPRIVRLLLKCRAGDYIFNRYKTSNSKLEVQLRYRQFSMFIF